MIKIENESLSNYLMFKLDKEENEFTEEELKNVDEIILNTSDINENYSAINLDIIKYFSGLKKIFLLKKYISKKDIYNLAELKCLKNIYLEKCEFEDADMLADLNLDEIELINCGINDYSFLYKMKELNSLSVIKGNLSITEINTLKNLRYLQLSYSNIEEIQNIDLPLLEELHIDNTNITDISIVKTLEKLKRIGISEKQFSENKEFAKKLMEKEIKVLNENMVEFNEGGELDD